MQLSISHDTSTASGDLESLGESLKNRVCFKGATARKAVIRDAKDK